MRPEQLAPYAPAVIRLLQGVLSADDPGTWNLLLHHETPVRDYLAKIGLELVLHETDGYAFLRQPELEGEEGEKLTLPRLTRRDRLTYYVTLMCALLRERIDQFEASTPEADRLILTSDDLYEMMRPFLRERGDERALVRKIDETASRVVELGFLRRLANEARYEVRPVIKARIGSEILAEVLARLEQYAATDA
ncbi:DUF4194 domain-containing protein [Candidatus Chloroploca sp. M-50]|uniref:DUF4194 domain-containing protein n=1 Tax=Candidatus Chloroploca mongolica TaxID=2528176 RepID=A0ABS4D4I7_9CHLR|nr:DUF4194 domain-containing protein [Candidatus Chloroploca mongolica]MBP1464339.1 DUF4194 domain-containing protein [Candidatus Chloroploca mongolica]